jgi:hypothetical protein
MMGDDHESVERFHMGIELIPRALRARFRFDERGHATAILRSDFRQEFDEILGALQAFKLRRSDILTPGGGRSPIPIFIDGFLSRKGWGEKSFDVKITVDGHPVPIPTHKIDNFKNRVGVKVEWNNKTEFYDRDLNNFRRLNMLNVPRRNRLRLRDMIFQLNLAGFQNE